MKSRQGFSLIEMAFVLVIVTLLLGGLLVPFTTQVEQKRIAETQKAMEEIKEALLGFAVANKRLPCPAKSPTDGTELGSCSTSPANSGLLPATTLGVGKLDAWGHQYRYIVSPDFTAPFALPPGTGTCPTSNNPCSIIKVNTRDASGNLSALSNGAVAVIISLGKNGYGGYNSDGQRAVLPNGNTDESFNADMNNAISFFSRTQVGPRIPCRDIAGSTALCEFDDLVTWLSPNVLFNRMVAAGKLP
ncbi:MAG: type II secretion system protein [Burkholderiales bacterium]